MGRTYIYDRRMNPSPQGMLVFWLSSQGGGVDAYYGDVSFYQCNIYNNTAQISVSACFLNRP
jgi:hypothetical protein